MVEDYRRAAERAKAAGFDGVEIHAANGYLIDQFLQSKTNQRTDGYGGSVENRFRFLREIVEAILTVWPAARLGVHLSPNGNFNDMGSPDFRETFTYAAAQLNSYGLAYLHVVDGLAFGFHEQGEPMTLPEFRAVFAGPLMGNCGYTQETAEAAIASGTGGPHRVRTALPEQSRSRGTLRERLGVESAGGHEGVVSADGAGLHRLSVSSAVLTGAAHARSWRRWIHWWLWWTHYILV